MDNTFLTATGNAMIDCLNVFAIPLLLWGAYLFYVEYQKCVQFQKHAQNSNYTDSDEDSYEVKYPDFFSNDDYIGLYGYDCFGNFDASKLHDEDF